MLSWDDCFAVLKAESGLSPLRLEQSSAWSSSTGDHRPALRQRLSEIFASDAKALGDLSRLPESAEAKISVSHCKSRGAFLTAPASCLAGIDLEENARCTAAVVGRLARPGELLLFPHPAQLWTAKEAAFKALSKAIDSKLTSDILIKGAARADGYWTFEIELPATFAKREQKGFVFTLSELTLAVYFIL